MFVCVQHNTAGVNCERCVQGFYRPTQVPPESPSGCIRELSLQSLFPLSFELDIHIIYGINKAEEAITVQRRRVIRSLTVAHCINGTATIVFTWQKARSML